MKDDLREALAGVRVKFWTCLVPGHRTVEWDGDLARCTAPGCEVTSAHTGSWARLVLESERAGMGRLDEAGLPVHLPIPVNEKGQGPTTDWEAREWVCWCGDDGCPLARDLGLAREAGKRAYIREVRPRLQRAVARLEENRDAARWPDRVRLEGKVEGVKLALSYLEEELR